jgi:hypothetical protein
MAFNRCDYRLVTKALSDLMFGLFPGKKEKIGGIPSQFCRLVLYQRYNQGRHRRSSIIDICLIPYKAHINSDTADSATTLLNLIFNREEEK